MEFNNYFSQYGGTKFTDRFKLSGGSNGGPSDMELTDLITKANELLK